LRRDENTFAAPSAGETPFQERRGPHGALAAPAPLGGNQPRGAGHPDPQHRVREIVNQGIRLHGISTWRTDRQQLESRTKQIKALAFKRCPVPFSATNFGGVRVEEKMAVTQDGVDALTAHPRGPRSCWPNPDVLLGEPGKATKTGTSPIMTSSVVYRSVV